METIESIGRWRRLVFDAGAVRKGVDRLLSMLHEASPLESRVILGELRLWLAADSVPLTPTERTAVLELLRAAPVTPALSGELGALVDLASQRSCAEPEARVGVALVLGTVREQADGEPIGAVWPLEVTILRAGGKVQLLANASLDALYGGFHQGIWSAQDLLARHGALSLRVAAGLRTWTFRGALSRVPTGALIRGESLGLGTAMATLSRLLDIPVPADVAFTGRVGISGRIMPVGDLEHKVQAAFDHGLRHVFVPADQPVPLSHAEGVEIFAVRSLDEVVERVLGATALADGERRLLRLFPGADSSETGPLGQVGSPRSARRIVLSCVGRSDPVGTILDQQRQPVGQEEGPALTVCRLLRPDAIYLFLTVEGIENNFGPKARALADLISEAQPGCQVISVPLAGLEDPTDYDRLVPVLGEAAGRVIEAERRRTEEICVNLSSGSPQMETTWHFLIDAWRRLPQLGGCSLRALQVREGRHVQQSGESRLRDVVLPVPLPLPSIAGNGSEMSAAEERIRELPERGES